MPGLGGTGALFHRLATELAPMCHAVTISYPLKLTKYDDLEDWIQPRLPKSDYILVAESFSGPLAIRLAASQPPGLRGVVFVATFTKSPRLAPPVSAQAMRAMPVQSKVLSQAAQPLLMGRWANTEFTDKFYTAIRRIPAATLANRLEEVIRCDESETLSRLTVPSIYLQATRDWLVPKRSARPFANHGTKIVPVEGPHFLLQSQPESCANKIKSFVTTLGP